MASVKAMMGCIGIPIHVSVSVLSDFFGFFRGRVPDDADPNVIARVSLLGLMNSLQGKHIHLNVIRVGIDNFTDDEIDKIDYAIYRIRNIYKQVSIGVGRVQHWNVTSEDADGKDDIGSKSEATELTHDWTVPNNGQDAFIVDNISAEDFAGISNINGPCNKNAMSRNGFVLEVDLDSEKFARAFAHEVGHYLGLKHTHGKECSDSDADKHNLMSQSRCAISLRDSVVLTSEQGSTMRSHCSVQDGC
ncbi:MAG TPA: zinc-dependent metalloprotease family protein [Pyrinomonadaceae bacterium]